LVAQSPDYRNHLPEIEIVAVMIKIQRLLLRRRVIEVAVTRVRVITVTPFY
jgi:hypothetical protein